ncbi:MAG TPA: recombinase family protein [Fimbriiglobus sp.]|nr:recombinase family protein [Fimbriiglobus sp.]
MGKSKTKSDETSETRTRAAVYARELTKDQANDSQDRLLALAAEKGYEVVAAAADVGTSEEIHPGLTDLVERAEREEFDVLLVERLDRLAAKDYRTTHVDVFLTLGLHDVAVETAGEGRIEKHPANSGEHASVVYEACTGPLWVQEELSALAAKAAAGKDVRRQAGALLKRLPTSTTPRMVESRKATQTTRKPQGGATAVYARGANREQVRAVEKLLKARADQVGYDVAVTESDVGPVRGRGDAPGLLRLVEPPHRFSTLLVRRLSDVAVGAVGQTWCRVLHPLEEAGVALEDLAGQRYELPGAPHPRVMDWAYDAVFVRHDRLAEVEAQLADATALLRRVSAGKNVREAARAFIKQAGAGVKSRERRVAVYARSATDEAVAVVKDRLVAWAGEQGYEVVQVRTDAEFSRSGLDELLARAELNEFDTILVEDLLWVGYETEEETLDRLLVPLERAGAALETIWGDRYVVAEMTTRDVVALARQAATVPRWQFESRSARLLTAEELLSRSAAGEDVRDMAGKFLRQRPYCA